MVKKLGYCGVIVLGVMGLVWHFTHEVTLMKVIIYVNKCCDSPVRNVMLDLRCRHVYLIYSHPSCMSDRSLLVCRDFCV